MAPQPDGSVAAGAGQATDTHVFTLQTNATGLRLLRFEALIDAATPNARVGLAKNGNAVVTSITAAAESVRDPAATQAIRWAWAWADHEQQNGDYDVHNALQPDALGWALEGHAQVRARNALLVADAPFGFEGGTID